MGSLASALRQRVLKHVTLHKAIAPTVKWANLTGMRNQPSLALFNLHLKYANTKLIGLDSSEAQD